MLTLQVPVLARHCLVMVGGMEICGNPMGA